MTQDQRRTLRILWAALLSSQLIYAVIGLSGLVAVGSGIAADVPFLPWILGAVAIGTALASHVLWRGVASRPVAGSGPGEAFARILPKLLVAWVLVESIAIYGLVLALLGFPAASWLPFMAGAVVLMLLCAPARLPGSPGLEPPGGIG